MAVSSEDESECGDGCDADGAHDGWVWADEDEDCSEDEDGGGEAEGLSWRG